MTLTAEQVEQRQHSIGSSDAAPAIGIEVYGRNRVTLWQEKTGRLVRPEIDTRQIRRGNFLERWIASEFAHERGVEVRRAPPRQHPKMRWLTARPDFRIVGQNALVECKSISPFALNSGAWGEEHSDAVPLHFLAQCMHQLIVTDAKVCYLAAMFADVLRVYVINRNAYLEEAIIEREAAFWGYVERDEPPPPATVSEVLDLFPRDNGASVVADDDAYGQWEALLLVRKSIKEFESEEASLGERLKVYLGERADLTDAHGRILATWRAARDSERINWQSVAEHLINEYADPLVGEAIIKRHTETKPGSRRFLVKEPKR